MPRSLMPRPLDHARSPLARLIRRDWIWRGTQTLDGVMVLRNTEIGGTGRAGIAPFLEHAASVSENSEAVVVLFDEPREYDCAMLGAALPLRRQNGAVASFPFDLPPDTDVAHWLSGRILIIRGGTPIALDAAGLHASDLARWIDIPDVEVHRAAAPPVRRDAPADQPLAISVDAVVERDFADSGLANLRKRIGKPERARTMPGDPAPVRWTVVALLAIAAVVVAARNPGTVSGEAVAMLLAAGLGLLATAALWRSWRSGPSGRPARTERLIAPAKSSKAPSAPPANPQKSGATLWWLAIPVALLAVLGLTDGWESRTALRALLVFAALGLLVYALGTSVGRVLAILTGASQRPARGSSPAQDENRPAPRSASSRGRWDWLTRLLRGSPMTDRAKRQYERRCAELQRLFQDGRIEEALKKALALDPRQDDVSLPRADEPVFEPGIRDRIKVAATRSSRPRALAALPAGARQTLEQLYRDEAARLVTAGEYEHAAFIFAELLDEPEAAVKVFADAGRFEVAARLAQGRRLDPALFIPLWYRAGDTARAIRLADRHGAYEVLLNSTDPADSEFRAFIRRIWAHRLADIGDYGPALSVSEPREDAEFVEADVRNAWLLAQCDAADIDPDVLARALKALPPPADENGQDRALAAFGRLCSDTEEDAARARQRLATLLLDGRFEPLKDPAFADRRLPEVADELARRMLADHASHRLYASTTPMVALAQAGGHAALAADIRRLPKVARQSAPLHRRHVRMGPIRGAAGVVAAAPLRGDRILAGFEDGLLHLVDHTGRVLWRDRVWKVRDIVAISPGRLALVIRDEPGGARLSVFDAETARHAEIGPIDIACWSPYAAAAGWLVWQGRRVLNLAIEPLIGALSGSTPTNLDVHWATPITVEGEVTALTHDAATGDAQWILRRPDGVLERWCVDARSLAVDYREIDLPMTLPAWATGNFIGWHGLNSASLHVKVHARLNKPSLRAQSPDRRREPGETPDIHVCVHHPTPNAPGLLPMCHRDPEGPEDTKGFALAMEERSALLTLEMGGAKTTWMREAARGDIVVVWDDTGRLAVLERRTGAITFANAELANKAVLRRFRA